MINNSIFTVFSKAGSRSKSIRSQKLHYVRLDVWEYQKRNVFFEATPYLDAGFKVTKILLATSDGTNLGKTLVGNYPDLEAKDVEPFLAQLGSVLIN